MFGINHRLSKLKWGWLFNMDLPLAKYDPITSHVELVSITMVIAMLDESLLISINHK